MTLDTTRRAIAEGNELHDRTTLTDKALRAKGAKP